MTKTAETIAEMVSGLTPSHPSTDKFMDGLGLLDGGLDSFGLIDLSLSIELHFGIKLSPQDWTATVFETVHSLAECVDSHLKLIP